MKLYHRLKKYSPLTLEDLPTKHVEELMYLSRMLPYALLLNKLYSETLYFDEEGRCRESDSHRIISRLNRNGYRRITIYLGGFRLRVMEHLAFWIWATGRWPKRNQEINHIDLNRENGRLDNLELVTRSKNMKHSYEMRRQGVNGGKR
jgi:hypothetical protein